MIRNKRFRSSLDKSEIKNNKLLRLILDDVQDGLWEYEISTDKYTIISKNKDFSYLNQNEESIVSLIKHVHPEDRGMVIEYVNQFILNNNEEWYENSYRVIDNDRNYVWIFSKGILERDLLGRPYKIYGYHKNINEKKELEERLSSLAYFDRLTETFNKERISLEFYSLTCVKNKENIAFFLINIDDFGYINNTIGYTQGNELLRKFATFLKFRYGDDYVSRINEDEFLILYPYKNIQNIEEEISDLFYEVNFQNFIDIHNIFISISAGISIYMKDSENFDELFKFADISLYNSKISGKNRFTFYSKEMSESTYKMLDMIKDVKIGIEKDEFEMYYQPIIDCKTKLLVGLEALIRWNHPLKGYISPQLFIKASEEYGEIKKIEYWIIENIFKQVQKWSEKLDLPLFVSINLSAKGLLEGLLVPYLEKMIKVYKIDPNKIEFEITETALLKNLNKSLVEIQALKNMGFKISLDDFGTGYSSLNYLKILPIDKVKLDKSFIDNIEKSNKDQMLTQSIIDISHNMGFEVVAEGIEKKEQEKILLDFNCDYFQGFLYCKPLNVKDINKWIRSNYLSKFENLVKTGDYFLL